MSSEDGNKKRKAASDTGGAAAPSSSKSHKTTANIVHQSTRSLLLNALPEILHKIYSFLTLKEALVLLQVHRQFNGASNDIYQYSFIPSYHHDMKDRGLDEKYVMNYLENQDQALCNLSDNDNLRAILRNETLGPVLAHNFLHYLVEHSKTDNGIAVTILIQQEGREGKIEHLEEVLKKGFTAMAAVLRQDERIKKDIITCRTCTANIGCYKCTSCLFGYRERYCRECVMEDDRFCNACDNYLCPGCFEKENFGACEKCGAIECRFLCEGAILYDCEFCMRKKCKPCVNEDGEKWSTEDSDEEVCPTCKEAHEEG